MLNSLSFDEKYFLELTEPDSVDTTPTPKEALKRLTEIGQRYRSGKRQSSKAVRDALTLCFAMTKQFIRSDRYANGASATKLLETLGLNARAQELRDPDVAMDVVPAAAIAAITKPKTRSQKKTASERARAVREVLASELPEAEAIEMLQKRPVRQLAAAFAKRHRAASDVAESAPEAHLVSFTFTLTASRKDKLQQRLETKKRVLVELVLNDDEKSAKLLKIRKTPKTS